MTAKYSDADTLCGGNSARRKFSAMPLKRQDVVDDGQSFLIQGP